MNIKNTFTFEPNKFDRNIFDKIFLKTNLSYGRLEFSKKTSISETDFNCDGNINLVEDFPSLTFKCLMILKDKKKFLRKFDIKYKIKMNL